jgi:hypothetical protein
MPVRALDANGSGFLSDVAAGIVYAADNGARIINLSLGGPSSSQTLRVAVDYAFAHNALPVAARGNGYAPDAMEPAYWYNARSVGAVDQSGAKADFSNYGPKADVVAHRLPAIYRERDYVESGGLMSYGADQAEPYKRAASMVDKILKGTKPADLPVEQPTKFEFVVNLKTAKQIGLKFPSFRCVRATQALGQR